MQQAHEKDTALVNDDLLSNDITTNIIATGAIRRDDQIITFSTLEAQIIQDRDGMVAPKYQFVLNKIKLLISKAHGSLY